jgi:3-oxoacyl-[acyl-carrier protein] reductase
VFDLTGRVAVVTGAGRGVGLGIARSLLARGAEVAINDLHEESAHEAAEQLGGHAAAFDVTDPNAVRTGLDAVSRALGPVDILVNNAGIPETMRAVHFADMSREEWAPYFDLNVYGSLNCIAEVLTGMRERRWGRIVQISSGAGRTGHGIGVSLYGASKSGIEGFIRHLALEVATDGVTANALALGRMDRPSDPDDTAGLGRSVPTGRLGTPADVGAAVVYLASVEAAWMTGQTVNLNGGAVTS